MDKTSIGSLAAAATPTFGPAVVSVFGVQVPILAFGISLVALLLARMIAPPSPRKLNRKESWALTTLLCIILFLAVTGEITGKPLKVGMSVVWAIGLGFSGLLVVEALADKIRDIVRVWLGTATKERDNE